MTSSSRRISIDTSKHRPLLKNKNPILHKAEARRMAANISLLSPEAQQAMIMTQEEARENISTIQAGKTDNITIDGSNNIHSNNNLGQRDSKSLSSGTDSKSTSLRSVCPRIRGSPVSRKVTVSSFSASGQAVTPRSRSTLSLTDRNPSISDNTESCYNYNTLKVNNTDGSCNTKDYEVPLSINIDLAKPPYIPKQLRDSNDNEMNENSEKVNNVDRNEDTEQVRRPESFVLALDRVLEKKCISRLRGDITHTTSICEPGKVRALDGGRLTNAQEVVVNVCHDDDTELIFNDDDEESLNNAKAVSEIRISLWMKYNEDFQPEDVIEDDYIRSTQDGNINFGRSNDAGRIAADATTERSLDKSCSVKAHTNARISNKSKWQTMKNDVNNNSGTLIKSKSGSSNNLRDASSTRTASTNRNDGGKGSRVSSLKKEKKS